MCTVRCKGVGEGCHKEMEAVLDKVLDSVLPYLVDEVRSVNQYVK